LNDYGGISLVYLLSSIPSTFITDEYVPTDTIPIKVLKNGEPYNGTISLHHFFIYGEMKTPALNLDCNGTIMLKIGNMNSYTYSNIDSFYWVYANDINTGVQVTSHGNNEILPVQVIDLG